jgi:hypothetical protein
MDTRAYCDRGTSGCAGHFNRNTHTNTYHDTYANTHHDARNDAHNDNISGSDDIHRTVASWLL